MIIVLTHNYDKLQLTVRRPAGCKDQSVEWMIIVLTHNYDKLQLTVSKPAGCKDQSV
jgi:hypothetical protein